MGFIVIVVDHIESDYRTTPINLSKSSLKNDTFPDSQVLELANDSCSTSSNGNEKHWDWLEKIRFFRKPTVSQGI